MGVSPRHMGVSPRHHASAVWSMRRCVHSGLLCTLHDMSHPFTLCMGKVLASLSAMQDEDSITSLITTVWLETGMQASECAAPETFSMLASHSLLGILGPQRVAEALQECLHSTGSPRPPARSSATQTSLDDGQQAFHGAAFSSGCETAAWEDVAISPVRPLGPVGAAELEGSEVQAGRVHGGIAMLPGL